MAFFETDLGRADDPYRGGYVLLHPRMVLAAIALDHRHRLITRGKFYLPDPDTGHGPPGGAFVKAFCKLLGLDDKDLITFFITLRNTMNTKAFTETPVERRAVFLPQCLRSAECPAHLTPEGLECRAAAAVRSGRTSVA